MSLADNLQRVRDAVAEACARAGRSPAEVKILAACKTVSPETIREAAGLGLRLFGENRVQEREAKRAALADLPLEWHLLGPLQSNKAARAVVDFDCIETLDSPALAQRLSRLAARPLPVLVEVNLAGEAQKHGVAPEAALALAEAAAELPRLRVTGLMAVPPQTASSEQARPHFAALRRLSETIRHRLGIPPTEWVLSMGMSQDYAVAIEEGATLVRLGTALFGARPRT